MKLLSHYLNTQQANRHQVVNWRENYVGESLFYSFRSTEYSRSTYPAGLHYHEYYELVIFVEGDVRYICEHDTYRPQYGDVILIPPGKMHMSMIDADTTRYTRHVFYLYRDAFDHINCSALTDFLTRDVGTFFRSTADPNAQEFLFSLVNQLDGALIHQENPLEQSLALGLILQIFYHLNTGQYHLCPSDGHLPPNVRAIQRYLDEHFTQITSVSQVAAHFYYSREYVSRLFKQYFNTSVTDYLMKRRVAFSQKLIQQGASLTEACFQSGFSSLSAFIRAFHSVAGMTPSVYRKMLNNKNT